MFERSYCGLTSKQCFVFYEIIADDFGDGDDGGGI